MSFYLFVCLFSESFKMIQFKILTKISDGLRQARNSEGEERKCILYLKSVQFKKVGRHLCPFSIKRWDAYHLTTIKSTFLSISRPSLVSDNRLMEKRGSHLLFFLAVGTFLHSSSLSFKDADWHLIALWDTNKIVV